MSWNTIDDYINDPAGFDAHHRQFKAMENGMANEQILADSNVKPGGNYVSGVGTLPPYTRKLEAVANAARVVVAVGGPLDPYDGEWVALADALDVLDGGDPTAKLYVDGGEWGSERTDGR